MIKKSFTKNICILCLLVTSWLSAQTLSVYLTKINTLKNKSALTNDPISKARLYNLISENYTNLCMTDSIKIYADKALKLAEKYNLEEEKAWAYVWLANYSKWTFRRNNLLDYCSYAYDLFKKLNSKKGIIKSLNLYGTAHVGYINKKGGLIFFEEALKILEQNPDPHLLMETETNIAQQYNIRRMYHKADSLYRIVRSQTFKYSDLSRRVDNNAKHAYTLKNMGSIEESIKLMEENIEMVKDLPNSMLVYDTYTDYAMFLTDAGKAEKALLYIEKAFQQPNININPDYTRLLYFNKVNALLKLGRYKEAYYAKLKESEYEEEKNRKLDNENLIIKRNAEKNQIEKERTEIYLMLFSSIAAILLIAASYFIMQGRQKTKNNLLLEEKVKSRADELISSNIKLNEEIGFRKQAEQILAESEEKYKSLFNNNHSVMLLVNPSTGSIVDANSAACRYYGWKIEEITAKKISEINTLSHSEIINALDEAKKENRRVFYFKHRLANGLIRDVEVFSGPIIIGGEKLLYSIVHDVTEKNITEFALKESEEKYRNLVQNSMIGVFRTKMNGDVLFINNTLAAMLEFNNPEDVIRSGSLFSYLNSTLRENLEMVLKNDGKVENYESSVLTRTGANKIFLFNMILSNDIISGTLVDITERKKVDEQLKEYLQLNEKLIVSSALGIIAYDTNGYCILANEAAARSIGATKEELLKQNFRKINSWKNSGLLDAAEKVLVTGETSKMETLVRTSFGKEIWIDCTFSRFELSYSHKLLFVYQDITERKKIEEDLRLKTEELDNYFTNALDLFCIANTDGYFLKLNREWEFTLGYKLEELEGIRFLDLVHPDDVDVTLKAIATLSSQKSLLNFSNRYRTKNGSYKIIEWRSRPAGNLIYAAARDISNRKEAEDAIIKLAERLDLATKAGNIGIWDWDIVKNILLWDDRMFELYGVRKSEFLGAYDTWLSGVHPDDRQKADSAIQSALNGEKEYAIEFRVLWPNNEVHYIQADGKVIRDSDGNPIRMIGTNYDISGRKKAEKEIMLINNDLLKLNSEKDKFFSIIAHDLKSPFQGLMGYSEILTTEYQTLSEDERISFINSISELSISSYKLLENLLDWSRIQTGKMIFSPENFNLLVELYHTLSLMKETANNKSIKFEHEIDNSIFIYADKNMLLTIIRNLVSNAIKFTNKGGNIILTVRRRSKTIEFAVGDNGVGIPKDNLDKLFLIGKNKSNRGTADEAGTGLGLILCKEMVEKHSGTIMVESEIGLGSKFTFSIPIKN